MSKQYYLPNSAEGKATVFEHLRDNVAPYAATFGLAAADIAQQAADATYFRELLTFAGTMSAAGPQWTAWKVNILTGTIGNEPAIPVKHANFPAAVPAGILTRFLALVKSIKANKNYLESIGVILGIEGAEQIAPDLSTLQPTLDATLNGNRVEIGWGWQGNSAFLDLLELQVDRGDGKGYIALAFDTTPGYVDTAPFPATPTKWTYRAIYRVADAQVGIWSLPVSITVGA